MPGGTPRPGYAAAMNRLGLVPATRTEPFHNIGADGVDKFLDLSVDGAALLPMIEAATGGHFDVVCPLTEEFPPGAVDFLEALLATSDRWTTDMGAAEGEVPLYVCPIDYDLWCGAIVATVTRDQETVRITRIRHFTGDGENESEERSDAAALSGLGFVFERAQVEELLGAAHDHFVAAARHWTPPDHAVGPLRRWARRARRLLRP